MAEQEHSVKPGKRLSPRGEKPRPRTPDGRFAKRVASTGDQTMGTTVGLTATQARERGRRLAILEEYGTLCGPARGGGAKGRAARVIGKKYGIKQRALQLWQVWEKSPDPTIALHGRGASERRRRMVLAAQRRRAVVQEALKAAALQPPGNTVYRLRAVSTQAGIGVSTLYRWCCNYKRSGTLGLVDGRVLRTGFNGRSTPDRAALSSG